MSAYPCFACSRGECGACQGFSGDYDTWRCSCYLGSVEGNPQRHPLTYAAEQDRKRIADE